MLRGRFLRWRDLTHGSVWLIHLHSVRILPSSIFETIESEKAPSRGVIPITVAQPQPKRLSHICRSLTGALSK